MKKNFIASILFERVSVRTKKTGLERRSIDQKIKVELLGNVSLCVGTVELLFNFFSHSWGNDTSLALKDDSLLYIELLLSEQRLRITCSRI